MDINPGWPGVITRRRLLVGLAAGAGVLLLANQAQAYEVSLSPTDPQMGDTIVVMVQATDPAATTPPTIVVDGSTQYPTFALGDGRFRGFVPTSPLSSPGRKVIQVTGSGDTRNLAVGLRNRNFPVQRINLPPGQRSLGTQHEFDRVAAFKDVVSPDKFWQGSMLRPNSGRVTAGYGIRRYYNGVFAENYYHRGVDYGAPTGSPVITPAAGRIGLVGRVSDGFELHGNTIGIDHGQGVLSIMLHLSRIDVAEGDFVQAGQRIGAVGTTGASTGPHLHWGLYVNGICIDPVPWRNGSFV
ncbi:M23 family metallopeptidase [Nodosilinea sp. P-1105]|uniref:M23 family metallopeptidase n=1 Tax=Nodosilinea sp. P-1105 TaxID=2546229 RepID=UPI00146F1110|nr:M23 family metallopeptidase [Nodosilinea sp. P-1105]NMF81753.1 M23 family metallopeptidase [Nodosilinea sp. P-1105]